MVKATAGKPKDKYPVRASGRNISKRTVEQIPPAGSGEVYIGDLMVTTLQAKYDGSVLQMQEKAGAFIPEENIRKAQGTTFDACIEAFQSGAALRANAAQILSAFDKEDRRLLMAVESRMEFEDKESDQNRAIVEYQDTNPRNPETIAALQELGEELRLIQSKKNYRISEIVAILAGDGLDQTF